MTPLITKRFSFEHWERSRLRVNTDFAPVLAEHGLTTFDAVMELAGGQAAKQAQRGRTTTRHVLPFEGRDHAFYLKRQRPPTLKAYLKSFLRLRRPVVDARGEWDAMIHFQREGIPTMTPVAVGRQGRYSFVLTEALDGFEKLSDWMNDRLDDPRSAHHRDVRAIAAALGRLTRTMHGANLHHQDFYIGHLLLPVNGDPDGIHVIDLGRARRCACLAERWIVKDLAQLNYSAHLIHRTDRVRFLRAYFGRPLEPRDKPLIRKVLTKSHAIARHTKKHGL